MGTSLSRRAIAGAVALVVAVGLLTLAGSVAPPGRPMLSAQEVPSIQGTPVAARPRPADLSQGAGAAKPVSVVWPSGSAEVSLVGSIARVRAGSLPVWLSGSGRAKVTVPERAGLAPAWRDAMVLSVAAEGQVTLAVDYSSFARANGADWSSRLGMVRVPACGLSTPDAVGCQATPVESTNDTGAKQVTASFAMTGAATFALTSGPSGPAGDFKATPLQASSMWTAGGNSGSFSWNYPMAVPPSLGGPAPQVALAYSSASVDGRSQATNNQPSWIGEGFEFTPGFIERRYRSCVSDGGTTGDMCWATDNASMALSGMGGELVRDDATGAWRLKSDDNSVIERLTGAANGDNDGEYWKVTTAEGTQFYFGLNRPSGWTGTAPADKVTNSTWTVPVAGNGAGEPCHGGTFLASFCTQAWRWNLDYVVDTHGNTMSLYYNQETNKYGRNQTATDVVSYVRGGWPDHIDYGTNNRGGTDTVNTSTAAPMRVAFGTADRCLTTCGDHANWPDTPWDQECTGSPCTSKLSPTFWTTRRLSTVTTKVWNGSAYKDVDLWTLNHLFPDPGDGTRAGLWLESIVHTGKATGPAVIGGDVALPEVNFDGVQLPNRVDSVGDGKFPMNWLRMSTIWTDTGAKIDVRYTGQDCVVGSRMPASPQSNNLRCYPVLEEQPDHSIKTEYFHKYLVTSVTQADRLTTTAPDVVTTYEYVGDPAWRFADDGTTQDNLRTWSEYRGYAQVKARVGGTGTESLTRQTFFRGMHGDLDGFGGTRTVTLPALDGNGDGDTVDTADAPAVADEDAYAGQVRQSVTFNGVETAPLATSIVEPWQSAPTATRNIGPTTVRARHVAVKTSWAATVLAAGGSRVSRVDTTLDTYGMPTAVDDQGDVAATGDEVCTKTTYNRNITATLLTLVGRVEQYGLRCSTNPSSQADVIADSRISFDQQAYGAPPTKGEATRVEVAKSWSSPGGSAWLQTSTAVYDAYGRPTDVTDVRGNHTTTAYTPATGGPVTQVATTTPLGTMRATLEPAWGSTTTNKDINNKQTDSTYDALGRLKQVWRANRPKSTFPAAPSVSYSYLIRNSGGVNAVTTAALNAASTPEVSFYTTTYSLYDGLLRSRQTQTVSSAVNHVGTIFATTSYDDHGRAVRQSQHFDATVSPGTTLFGIQDWQPLTQTVSVYDRADRVVEAQFQSGATVKWKAVTNYGGDRVSVTPPAGGIATTTVVDARGRTVELRQYKNAADVGSNTRSLYDLASYHYNRQGRQDSITDNAGNAWTYTYDLLGRRIATHDPDAGNSSATFNDAGDQLTSTDGRNVTIAYHYDSLGRKDGEYAGSVASANLLATWTYDPFGAKGQLASSSRILNAGADEYKVRVRGYTQLYQSTGEEYTIPPALTGLSGTYTVSRTYAYDGSLSTVTYPAAGELSLETVDYTYDEVTGLPTELGTTAGEAQYVTQTKYTQYGELTFQEYMLLAGAYLQRSFAYDDITHRLKQTTTARETSPIGVESTAYDYDNVGNIKSIASSGDNQCFAYDYARRLTEAWTPTSGDCQAARSVSTLGGPAPYWTSWTFDPVGNRASQTVHATGGNTLTNYTYPASGPTSVQPHTLSSTTTGSTTQNYAYDQTGNTTCRPSGSGANTCPPGAGSQTLTWDAHNHLATVSGGNSYIYDASGNRLVADDATSTTLYLPGTEIKRTKATGALTPARYFTFGGRTIAMKTTGGAVTWLIDDHQGTQSYAVAAGNQAISVRRQTPYGAPRGTPPSWPNAKSFVGGDKDPTGLIHIGAREYDAATGRFTSVDPVFDQSDPQSWSGYAYSGNNPVTFSDPTGLEHDQEGCGEACQANGGRIPIFIEYALLKIKAAAAMTLVDLGDIGTIKDPIPGPRPKEPGYTIFDDPDRGKNITPVPQQQCIQIAPGMPCVYTGGAPYPIHERGPEILGNPPADQGPSINKADEGEQSGDGFKRNPAITVADEDALLEKAEELTGVSLRDFRPEPTNTTWYRVTTPSGEEVRVEIEPEGHYVYGKINEGPHVRILRPKDPEVGPKSGWYTSDKVFIAGREKMRPWG